MDILKFPGNNGKLFLFTGGNIHGIYSYLEKIWSPNNLNYLDQLSHHFGTSYSTKNDKTNLFPVIESLRILQKVIC